MKYLKTKLVSIVVLLSVLMCGNVKADNIDLTTAKQIGAYYFNVATGTKAPVSAEKLELVQQFDNPTLCIPALYAFNVADNGFVVVSASNCTDPVLAYSPDGRIDSAHISRRRIIFHDIILATVILGLQNSVISRRDVC